MDHRLARDYESAFIVQHSSGGVRGRDCGDGGKGSGGDASGIVENVNNSESQLQASCNMTRSDSICTVCFDGEDLLCCGLCPRAYHRHCIETSKRIVRGRFDCTMISDPIQFNACTARTDPID